jgi:hypothetical protein
MYLLWLHRRRPTAFPLVRTSLLLASALALIGYLTFPTAPPRDAALGTSDLLDAIAGTAVAAVGGALAYAAVHRFDAPDRMMPRRPGATTLQT